MLNNLIIHSLTHTDLESAYKVFETAIPDAFEKEGIGSQHEFITSEIEYKKNMLDTSLNQPDSGIHFLIAKEEDNVIGTISFGPCGKETRDCTDGELDRVGELGSLYILPSYQAQGVGSALIGAMAEHLDKQGVEQFCLDSGYQRAQKRWLRKFGVPYKIAKDYWGPGADHLIWLCKVSDFTK